MDIDPTTWEILGKRYHLAKGDILRTGIKVTPMDCNSHVYGRIFKQIRAENDKNENFNLDLIDIIKVEKTNENQLAKRPVKLLYHTSKNWNIKSILMEGLSLEHANQGCFGTAIYFTPFISHSCLYGGPSVGDLLNGQMAHCLLHEVEVGNSLSRWERDRTRTTIPAKYDSLRVEGIVKESDKHQVTDQYGFIWNTGGPQSNELAYPRLVKKMHYYTQYGMYENNKFNLRYVVRVKKFAV